MRVLHLKPALDHIQHVHKDAFLVELYNTYLGIRDKA